MKIIGDISYASCADMWGFHELTPELESVLCLRWISERMRNSGADGARRLGQVFSAMTQSSALVQAHGGSIHAHSIQGMARSFDLQVTCTHSRTLTSDFSALARVANAQAKKSYLILVETDKGHVYPTAVYKSGGKFKGSHLYVFLPLCGELRLSPGGAGEILSRCISLSLSEGEPVRFDAYEVDNYTAKGKDNPSYEGIVSGGGASGAVGMPRHADNSSNESHYEPIGFSPSPSPEPPPVPPRRLPVKPPVAPKPAWLKSH